MFPQHSMSLPSGFRIHQTEPSTLHSTTSTTFSKTHYTSSPIGNPCSLATTQVHVQEHLHLSSHTSSLPYQQNSEKHSSTSPSILVLPEYNQQPSTQAQTTSISNMPKKHPSTLRIVFQNINGIPHHSANLKVDSLKAFMDENGVDIFGISKVNKA